MTLPAPTQRAGTKTPANRLRELPVPTRMSSKIAVLLSIVYAVISLIVLVFLSRFLEWYWLIYILFGLLAVWGAYFERPFREAFNKGRDVGRLADILESSRHCVLLLRPFKDESNLADAAPTPNSLGTIEPSLTDFYKELQLAIGNEFKIVGLRNDSAKADTKAIDMILVPNNIWQETVAIAAEGADKIIICMSSTGSGVSLFWELDLLEADPEFCAKTIIFAQPHGWLKAYEKIKASHERSARMKYLYGSNLPVLKAAFGSKWNQHKLDIRNWPGSPSEWKLEDKQFWDTIRDQYPKLSTTLFRDVNVLADFIKNELLK